MALNSLSCGQAVRHDLFYMKWCKIFFLGSILKFRTSLPIVYEQSRLMSLTHQHLCLHTQLGFQSLIFTVLLPYPTWCFIGLVLNCYPWSSFCCHSSCNIVHCNHRHNQNYTMGHHHASSHEFATTTIMTPHEHA